MVAKHIFEGGHTKNILAGPPLPPKKTPLWWRLHKNATHWSKGRGVLLRKVVKHTFEGGHTKNILAGPPPPPAPQITLW